MDMGSAYGVELGLILVLVTFLILWIYSYSLSLSSKSGIPEGRFWQIPFVGETLTLTSGSFEDFLRPRLQRYGRNFRTHLLGDPCICITSFDKIKFVLQSPQSFRRSFSKATRELMAPSGEMASNFTEKKAGHIHRSLSRSAVRNFIPELDRRCKDMLAKWERMETVPFVEELEKFAFTSTCIFNCDYLISEEDTPNGKATSDQIRSWLYEIRNGLIVLPVNLPGTAYNRALKARKILEQEIMRAVTRRRAEKGLVRHHDVLDAFIQAGDVIDRDLVELLIGFLFAGLETSATALAWIMINLLPRPDLVALVREENERLAEERRTRPDDTITVDDIYEKLPLTNQVIQETLRLHNIAAFTTREATEDILHEGMLFPKGWKVLVTWVALHKDPNNHSNPHEFDPSRFASESASKPNNYMPFGKGPSYCKGQDAFKVEAAIFLHHLLEGYDFEIVGKVDKIISSVDYLPTPRPHGAVPITVSRRRPEAKSSL